MKKFYDFIFNENIKTTITIEEFADKYPNFLDIIQYPFCHYIESIINKFMSNIYK